MADKISCSQLFRVLVLVFFSLVTLVVDAGAEKVFGVIDDINHENSRIIIDDHSFKMALNFKVYDKRGKEVNRYSLKVGQKLNYIFTDNPNGTRNIISANIEAENFLPTSSDED